jgi:hypothetical protein
MMQEQHSLQVSHIENQGKDQLKLFKEQMQGELKT